MRAFLILEDGHVFAGEGFGAAGRVISEIVFNTSMTGYLEVLTDPSYAGQSVVMTYPLIGNYGICREDMESERPWLKGYIVRELSRRASNFRSEETIQDFLARHGIACISGVDTRAITRILREKGTMMGMIVSGEDEEPDVEECLDEIRAYVPEPPVLKVTLKEKKHLAGSGRRVALMDFGMKKSIAGSLAKRGLDVTIFPADAKAEDILKGGFDGIMLSNGPGDPKDCGLIIQEVKKLADSGIPIFAICLGHQLMALAMGGDTRKLKYGHRGGNHPVKDLATGRVYISSQNHGYVVDPSAVDPSLGVPSFINVNDGTNEGMIYKGGNIYTVQFHPEACPGPRDTDFLFDHFVKMMEVKDHAEEK